jgi:ethanolamine ammonia-lyase small subunit
MAEDTPAMDDSMPPMAELAERDPDAVLRAAALRTPARVLRGRAGTSYRTETQLSLRRDHAAAVDAVHAELELARDLGSDFVARWGLFEVGTRAASKADYLRNPALGRQLAAESREALGCCPRAVELQVAVGDGLSAAAVAAQVPALLPMLYEGAQRLGWRFGQPFFIRYCRVGILNDVGECLDPSVAVLLIGERPGLLTAESLSAYMAYRPRAGHTDADRNLVSNIHLRGTPPVEASARILRLAERMMQHRLSGCALKEDSPGSLGSEKPAG